MNQLEDKNFNPGALVRPPSDTDYVLGREIGGGTPEFDWENGFDIEEKLNFKTPIKDQNGSSSCGGQAWAYLGESISALHHKKYVEKSAKFIYAHTHVGVGGSDGLTNCKLVKTKGWGNEADCSSYENGNPPSEAFMIRQQDITPEAYKNALMDKALAYAQVPLGIDSIAQALRDQNGVIIGIDGQNNGSWRKKFPKPPKPGDVWSHWVRIGKAKMIDGKKYLGFSNSWGESTGEDGWQWIGEDYINNMTVIGSFTRPSIWSLWTMVYDSSAPKPLFGRTLHFGSKGDDVKQLQKLLNMAPSEQDGKFGKNTLRDVKLFQSLHNLLADGIVGPKTQAALQTLIP